MVQIERCSVAALVTSAGRDVICKQPGGPPGAALQLTRTCMSFGRRASPSRSDLEAAMTDLRVPLNEVTIMNKRVVESSQSTSPQGF
jgi:hypothetical protein